MRTLEITKQQGLRWKDFREAVHGMIEDQFEDWPLDEPRSVLWLLRSMVRYNRTPTTWLDNYFTKKKYADQDRAKHELRCLAGVLMLPICYDQLNVVSLADVERLMRRWQLIIEAHERDPLHPIHDDEDHYNGLGDEFQGVSPALSKAVATEIRETNEIDRYRSCALGGTDDSSANPPKPPRKVTVAGKGEGKA